MGFLSLTSSSLYNPDISVPHLSLSSLRACTVFSLCLLFFFLPVCRVTSLTPFCEVENTSPPSSPPHKPVLTHFGRDNLSKDQLLFKVRKHRGGGRGWGEGREREKGMGGERKGEGECVSGYTTVGVGEESVCPLGLHPRSGVHGGSLPSSLSISGRLSLSAGLSGLWPPPRASLQDDGGSPEPLDLDKVQAFHRQGRDCCRLGIDSKKGHPEQQG